MKPAAEARATWLANVPVYPLTAAQKIEESKRFVRASRCGLYKVLT